MVKIPDYGALIAAIALGLILLAVVLEVAFIFCFTVAALIERNLWMPTSMRLLARVLFYVGVVADVLYNQTYGRYWFGEWLDLPWKTPGGIMFSGRVQQHIDFGDGKQLETAIRWADLLNAVAPNHIKRVDAARVRLASSEDRILGDTHL
jgi:hypothetical protein